MPDTQVSSQFDFLKIAVNAWNTKNLDQFLSCLTEDVFWDDPAMEKPARGRDAVKSFAISLWRAFPDLQYIPTEEPYISSDPKRIALPWKMTGTMLGPVYPPGFAPTGRRLGIDGVDLVEFRNGRMCRIVTRFDGIAMAQQIGLLPPRPVPGSWKGWVTVFVQRLIAWYLRRSTR